MIKYVSPQRDLSHASSTSMVRATRLEHGELSVRVSRSHDGHASGAPPRGRPRLPIVAAALYAVALAVALLAPGAAHARDLVVFGEPTLERALKSIGALWQARTGTRVNVFVAPSDLSYAQIDRGARCDVVFGLTGAVSEDAARRKIIHADTVRRVLRNSLALIGTESSSAATADATLADISRLIAGKTLAIANPEREVAGAHAVELLRRIGVTVDDHNKSVAVAESSAGVVSFLATNKARLGIVYATDAVAGFKLVVPLSALELPAIEYVVAKARYPEVEPQPFMSFLQSAEAKATFRSAGLAPIDDQSVIRREPASDLIRIAKQLVAQDAATRLSAYWGGDDD
jgi:molybdenum ABC transporter molybdate-binding protein